MQSKVLILRQGCLVRIHILIKKHIIFIYDQFSTACGINNQNKQLFSSV